jgi:deoxyribose-phosphate aldolase
MSMVDEPTTGRGAEPTGTGRGLAAWPAKGRQVFDVATSEASLKRFVRGLPGVDQVGAEARAAMLATRSIKAASKRWAIDAAIAMVDLTTLEGCDTPGKVEALCAKARRPDPRDPSVPSVAAVCVYPDLVGVAADRLAGSEVRVASVATAFPSGRSSLAVKLADVRESIDGGAHEVDMVIDRGAFLAGRYGKVYEEICAVRELAAGVVLKVILETGELATLDNVMGAAWIAMLGGADFVKTSTGKVSPAATRPVASVLFAAVRDFARWGGPRVGVKVAGGIRTTKEAISYLVIAKETAGDEWLTSDGLRIGASTLLNDLLMQREKQRTGVYAGRDYFTND